MKKKTLQFLMHIRFAPGTVQDYECGLHRVKSNTNPTQARSPWEVT